MSIRSIYSSATNAYFKAHEFGLKCAYDRGSKLTRLYYGIVRIVECMAKSLRTAYTNLYSPTPWDMPSSLKSANFELSANASLKFYVGVICVYLLNCPPLPVTCM